MDAVLDALSWGLLVLGGALCVVGGIGLHRLPDFYARTHAGGVTDTLATWCILFGLLLQAPDWMVAVRLVLIVMFLFFTSPASGHALVRAAFTSGLQPKLRDQILLTAAQADDKESHDIWTYFQHKFTKVGELGKYVPFFQRLLRSALKACIK